MAQIIDRNAEAIKFLKKLNRSVKNTIRSMKFMKIVKGSITHDVNGKKVVSF